MARLLVNFSGACILRKVTVCLVICTAIPVFAQPAELPTGAEPEKILPIEPDSLEGKFDAALLMVKLARPKLAKTYLTEILAMEPTAQQMLRLRDKYGTAVFLGFINTEGLDPEASQLLELLNQAVAAKLNDPEYAATLLSKLEGTGREREEALTALRHLGADAIPPMIYALENDTVNRDVLIFNMTRLGDEATPPIIGALSSPSDKVRNAAAEVLGWIGGEQDAIWLWNSAFSINRPPGVQSTAREALARILYGNPRSSNRITSYGAAEHLISEAVTHLAGRHQWNVRYEDMQTIPIWTWNADQFTVVKTEATRQHASLHFAERLGREALEVNSKKEDALIVVLAAQLSRDIESAGWDQPIPVGPGTAHNLAITAGPDICSQVLALAIDNNITPAALSAATAISLNGSRDMLNATSRPATIVEALDYPHPRVQFAAAVSILQWEPEKKFRGARRVVEILARAIQADSTPDSVVVDPNVQRATLTASQFGQLGYNSSIASTGMDGFQIAAKQGDVELAVLHPNTIRWGLTQTIENLRADSRTRNLPLVIYGPASMRDRFERVRSRFQNVVYVNESVDPLDINRELNPVLAQLSPPPLTQSQRTAQLSEAAYWLRWIATRSTTEVFNLSEHEDAIISATSNPLVADDAIITLGSIPSNAAQRRLLELTESPDAAMKIRQRAGLQLAFHIQRYGRLLTPAEIDRVKALATDMSAAPEVRTAIASVVGSLKPNAAAIRKLILDAAVSNPISAEVSSETQE